MAGALRQVLSLPSKISDLLGEAIRPSPLSGVIQGQETRWLKVGPIDELSAQVRLIFGCTQPVFVSRTGDEVRALKGICPVDGAILRPQDDGFSCSFCGQFFDLAGKTTSEEVLELSQVDLKLEGGDVWVQK